MDRVKTKINSCGIDGITEQELIEMKYWTCVADAMTSYDYHYKIIEEMEKPENQYRKNYDEHGKYYTQPRMNETYDVSSMYYRDMDMNKGRMYYTDSTNMGINDTHTMRGYSESGYERARRGFEESKMMNPNAEHTEKIEEMFRSLEEELKELKPKMTPTEKNTARNKMTSIANSMM